MVFGSGAARCCFSAAAPHDEDDRHRLHRLVVGFVGVGFDRRFDTITTLVVMDDISTTAPTLARVPLRYYTE